MPPRYAYAALPCCRRHTLLIAVTCHASLSPADAFAMMLYDTLLRQIMLAFAAIAVSPLICAAHYC